MKLTLLAKEVRWLQEYHANRIKSIEKRSNPEFFDVEFTDEVDENIIWDFARGYQIYEVKTINKR